MELETDHPGIIYAYLLSIQDNVLTNSPVTAFQANKVKKTGGWFCGFRTTRLPFTWHTKQRLKGRAGNVKKGVYATRGCVSMGTLRRGPGRVDNYFLFSQLPNLSTPFLYSFRWMRNHFEMNFENPKVFTIFSRLKRLNGTIFPVISRFLA